MKYWRQKHAFVKKAKKIGKIDTWPPLMLGLQCFACFHYSNTSLNFRVGICLL